MKPLFSTAYLPPIAWLSEAVRHEEIVIETKETFPKQTFRNRTVIMTAGGIRPLSVPTRRNNHSRTDEVLLDYTTRWNIIHLRTIQSAYSAAPYFLYYFDGLEQILKKEYSTLLDLNAATTAWLLRQMKCPTRLSLSSDWTEPTGEAWDFRYAFSPKLPTDTLRFPKYYQVFSDRFPFAPNLSGLDLLMNIGPESLDYLKSI